MDHANAAALWLVTQNDALIAELEWTLKRAGIEEPLERFATVGDVRDALTTRVRSGGLPAILAVDMRAQAVAGSQLVKWVASTTGLKQILVIAFTGRGTAANVMHLLGADAVFETCPDAAKLAQLHGIGRQLAQLPPPDDARPTLPSRPIVGASNDKSAGRPRRRGR
jgi:hypothetical protein